jgi:hypothetical protein
MKNVLKRPCSHVCSFLSVMSLSFFVGCNTNDDASAINNPRNPYGDGPAAVVGFGNDLTPGNLGQAGNYTILAETGISTTVGSSIEGDIGLSPYAASFVTGFDPIALDSTGEFSTASMVNHRIYASDYVGTPATNVTPANLTAAVNDMHTAYTDAAGRTPADFLNLGSGEIGNLTLAPGLYTFGSDVTISLDSTIAGSATDVWIFQVSGNLSLANAKSLILSGGAQAKNIYWQVAGYANIGTTAHFEGIILSKTAVHLLTNATMVGTIFAQSAVTLDSNAITLP